MKDYVLQRRWIIKTLDDYCLSRQWLYLQVKRVCSTPVTLSSVYAALNGHRETEFSQHLLDLAEGVLISYTLLFLKQEVKKG